LETPQNYKQVIERFKESPEEVRGYFPALVPLIQGFGWDVSIGYVFSRIEQAKRMTIYCGLVKLWEAEKERSWGFVAGDYLSRKRFLALFKAVFDLEVPKEVIQKLKDSEAIRDRVMHGGSWKESDARKALALSLDFAADFNDFVEKAGGPRPFGDLRGFKGAGKPISARMTEILLLGISKKASPKEAGSAGGQVLGVE
jgi:hypothetical protein